MDKEGSATKCPLCSSQESVDLDRYPGSFLSCERLVQCLHCELIWAVPLPSILDLNDYYSGGLYYEIVSDPYNVSFKEWSLKLARSRLDLISSMVGIAETSRVLDVGGGNGLFGKALMEYSAAIEYDVVEPDDDIRARHNSQVRTSYRDLNSVKKDYYDLIVLNQVVEHVPDPTNFVKTACTALRQGGYIFVDVPNKDHLYKPSVESHILFWGKESMNMLFDQIGLKMIFCNTVGMPHSQAARFFARSGKLRRLFDCWNYLDLLNRVLGIANLKMKFDTFSRFQANSYGGERQWLRSIGQKID
jgi:2-polyprenyl-3-methyl-5-hydroxy-6-metoxy-1,4-benzoquinol methylase